MCVCFLIHVVFYYIYHLHCRFEVHFHVDVSPNEDSDLKNKIKNLPAASGSAGLVSSEGLSDPAPLSKDSGLE